jgi:1,4-alpha-glucan branching enzyme
MNRKTTTKKSTTTATKKTTRKTTRKTTPKVSFELFAPEKQQVSVTGDFTSWDSSGIELKKDKKGYWKTNIVLQPGRYEYKFIVDEEWWTDPNNDNVVDNGMGSLNSIIDTAS